MNVGVYIILAVLAWLVAMQVSVFDLKELSGKISSRWLQSNTLGIACLILLLAAFVADCWRHGILTTIISDVVLLFLSVGWVWVISKVNTLRFSVAALMIFIPLILVAYGMSLLGLPLLSPLAAYGFYYRNCPFGNVFGKRFLLIKDCKGTIAPDDPRPDVEADKELLQSLQDFSYSGCQHDTNITKRYNVEEVGVMPGSSEDVLSKVQALIDKVGENGGGVIFFPKGKYLFNKDKGHPSFLQINHSDITIEGETDENGKPLVELVNCNNTVRGKRNPWLSPFFITTGEALQESNMFWGIQFKRKRNIVTRSSSLADPGSDGTILTPGYATSIVEDADKGERVIRVRDASTLSGIRYIVLAMFNNEDGDLIKDILCVKDLRPEWGTALRAGEEKAPSYQALLEIASIDVDNNTMTLTQPLRRDISMRYSPEVYSLEMLEHVVIRNLTISSRWNGLFRHHGFPLYYSVSQTQEMDYGWNGINMKRVAHGRIENVIFRDLSNPLYVMDSRNITVENILFTGYDGHQGIKLYEHACDNLLRSIEFRNHYADMMGGEGNAYGNVFSRVRYTNPFLNPVDYDFHGFSEGPMSPPSYNLFELIHGFAHIKAAGASYNQPASARENLWWNTFSSGETKGDNLFVNLCYVPKGRMRLLFSAVAVCMQQKRLSPSLLRETFRQRVKAEAEKAVQPPCHHLLFPRHTVVGGKTTSRVVPCATSTVEMYYEQHTVAPLSLYDYQLETLHSDGNILQHDLPETTA